LRSNSTLSSRPTRRCARSPASFTIGAGRVRIDNPDAAPFFIDEASGAIAWMRMRAGFASTDFRFSPD